MDLINSHHGVGVLLRWGPWGQPFRLSASSWAKWVPSGSVIRTKRLRTAISTVPAQRRNRSLQGRDFLAALPRKEGPIPRLVLLRKRGEKARNQACQAPRPLSAVPPPLPSTAGSRLAGTPCLVGGKGRERAGPAGFPGPRRRVAVTAANAPPSPLPPALAPGAVCPVVFHRSAAAHPRAAGAERLSPTGAIAHPARSPRRWAGAGEREVSNPLFWEVRR